MKFLHDTKDFDFQGHMGFARKVKFDLKSLKKEGEFEGYASTFGNVDQGGDIVMAGAFDQTLSERPANKIKMLMYHDTRRPVGVWDQAYTDSKGLYVRGSLLLKTTEGRDAHELIKAGALDGLSIGYHAVEDKYDNQTGTRTIIRADLREISHVTFPMNEQTLIMGIKSFKAAVNALETLKDAELMLREAGGNFTRKQATDFISVVRKIVQREAVKGQDDGETQSINDFLRRMQG